MTRTATNQQTKATKGQKEKAGFTGDAPLPDEVKALRQNVQEVMGLNITQGQDYCAAKLWTSRRAWQQWETGDRNMHPAFWELAQIKTAVIRNGEASRNK